MCKQWYGIALPTCPSKERFVFEAYSPCGRIEVARAVIDKEIPYTRGLGDVIFSCTSCAACNEVVYYCGIKPLDIIEEFKATLIDEGFAPPKVRDMLENITKHGNPYGEAREKRGKWAEGLPIKRYEKEMEYLYYVGCVGSYDPRSQEIAKTFASILLRGNVSFGILGNEEFCDGNEVLRLGEYGLFETIAKKNIKKLRELGVKKIVTISPHVYNAFKNEYPKYGGDFEVYSHVELLRDLLKDGKLSLKEFNVKITYHDPCFLGRYNRIYDIPREVLTSIPGVELVEMERNREKAFCCGGGGGNFFTDFLGGNRSPARIRVREAYATNANILAVACPICMFMLDDAVKSEELEDKLKVKDVSEIINEVIG